MLRAETTVKTAKGARYLRALCNHFDRKVTAEYTDNNGRVQFGFADCTMAATDTSLIINVQANDHEGIERAKFVVSDHLTRFAPTENLTIAWIDHEQNG